MNDYWSDEPFSDQIDLTKTYFKVLAPDLCNKGYQYVIGPNELKEEFLPYRYCGSGGLYFCELEHIKYWLNLHPDGLVCEVTLPSDVLVVSLNYKYKANKIIISNPLSINDFVEKHHLYNIIAHDGLLLRYIDNQTEELCLTAIINNPESFKYIKNQTSKLCIEAISLNPLCFCYIDSNLLSDHICKFTLECCKNQKGIFVNWHYFRGRAEKYDILFHNIFLKIVMYNGLLLEYIEHQTKEICKNALKQNINAFKFVQKQFQTYEMCHDVVEKNGLLLEFVDKKTIDLCVIAMKQNRNALSHVPTEFLSECISKFSFV